MGLREKLLKSAAKNSVAPKANIDNGQEYNNDEISAKASTRKSIGYVEGYSEYISRSGGLVEHNIANMPANTTVLDGNTESVQTTNDAGEDINLYRSANVKKPNTTESDKPIPSSNQVNKQVDEFRNIFGYKDSTSDAIEDPTFIIFDMQMDYGESSLFNSVEGFFNDYSGDMEELDERLPLYDKFVSAITKIFPGDINKDSGTKRHYINSISGMDVLFKKIIDYPVDVISIKLSEDITMLSQYISELYNNLVYSYDSHRFMIPENLLRFNLTIFFRDVREMKSVTYKEEQGKRSLLSEEINDNMSKFAYVLHDCQFDFFNSRNFGADVNLGGFDGGGATTTPSSLSFNINFKSYSKIMLPHMIDNSIDIDLRERNKDNNYDRFNNDYKSQYELSETEFSAIQGGIDSGNLSNRLTKKQEDKKTPIKDYANNIWDVIKKEGTDLRNVLVNTVFDEVTALSVKAQTSVSDAIFGGLNLPNGTQPLTLTRVNIYYDDPAAAISRVGFLVENFLDDAIDDIKGNINASYDKNAEKGDRLNIYWGDKDTNETWGGEIGRIATDSLYGPKGKSYDGNVNDRVTSPTYSPEEKDYQTDTQDDGSYNKKYPVGKVNIGVGQDGLDEFSDRYESGDVSPDGVYNNNPPYKPDGTKDLNPDGVYNNTPPYKPDGTKDLNPDGQYNEKSPEGDLHPDGTYNEKLPDGDLHPDGTYNEKLPDGDLHPDGVYNEKYPGGDLHPDGQYNTKYPNGDLHPDGTYNEKEPEGDVHPDGEYNEKEPNGVVQEKGTYNEKEPSGDVQPDGQYNEKEPSGDVQPDGEYNTKFPEGDVQPDGQYNEKEPNGDVYVEERELNDEPKPLDNVYGHKEETLPEEPSGDVHPDGEYNDKHPKGNIYKKDDDK